MARAPGIAARRVARAPRAAVRRPARALADIGRYWYAERGTMWQGFIGLAISSGGDLLAGVALGVMNHRLAELPSLLILVPAAIGMRGNIFGAVGSRLGTSIHTGQFRVTRDRAGILYQNAYASLLLSILTSTYLAAAARVISAAVGLPAISIWDFIVISVLGGVISSVVVLTLTVILSAISFRREWDMDSIAAPVVTFMGDTITLPALFGASFLARHGPVTLTVGALLAALTVYAIVMAVRTQMPYARRIIKESVVVLALAGTMDLIAGTVIQHRVERFLALPALLVLIPPFLEDAGALGSIVSARIASKLHLGAIRPRLLPERLAGLDITLAAPGALFVFTMVGFTSHWVARATGLGSPGLLKMIGISLLAGYLATIGAAIIAYAAAVATYRFGWDPDNHGIPIVTSSLDLIGMIALVGTVVLFHVH